MGMMQLTGPVLRAFALSCVAIAMGCAISVWASFACRSQQNLTPALEVASALPGPLDGGPSNPKPKANPAGSCAHA